jgi:replication factor C subunit 3/5
MFFPDKYAPKTMDEMVFHLNILKELETISKKDNIPHMIFYGQSESGRRTLITRFLEMIFDKSINNLCTAEFPVISTGTSSKTIVQLKQSNHHIIIEPTGTNFDKHIISYVVKAYVLSAPLSVFRSNKTFKVVLINNADKLTIHAQTALRRTMEIYSNTCKFILWCAKYSSIIKPIRSRCLPMRIPVPTSGEIMGIMINIANKENIKITFEESAQIVKNANSKIKEALWKLQLIKTEPNKKKLNPKTIYEHTIDKMIELLNKPDIRNLDALKVITYEIIITNLQPTYIITTIMDKLLQDDNLTEAQMCDIIAVTADYEHRTLLSRRPIIQLDGFMINIFNVLHNKKDLSKPVENRIKKIISV